jgi:hypothetical protein
VSRNAFISGGARQRDTAAILDLPSASLPVLSTKPVSTRSTRFSNAQADLGAAAATQP